MTRRLHTAAKPIAFVVLTSGLVVGLVASAALANPDPPARSASAQDGRAAFRQIAAVLQSPRCRNCHPNGDAPLQTDAGRRHALNISRLSAASGLACSTCHQEKNSEAIGIAGGPPGAPRWGLPPAETPMIFQGRSLTALCEQLKDPARNGQRSLADLYHHIRADPLVLWAWQPGGRRKAPPVDHATFARAFATWVASNGACP